MNGRAKVRHKGLIRGEIEMRGACDRLAERGAFLRASEPSRDWKQI